MNRISIVLSVLVVAISVTALSVSLISANNASQVRIAGVPSQIAYQGYLEDDRGDAITGTHTVQFNMYRGSVDRNPQWQESHTISTSDGFFSVMLGSVEVLDRAIFDSGEVYLGVAVGREAESVRQPLGSVPFAIIASRASSAESLDCAGCVTTRHLADGAVSQDKISGGSTTGSSTTLTSDNGEYTVEVANDGITFIGPDGVIRFRSDNDWAIETNEDLTIASSKSIDIDSGDDMTLDSDRDLIAKAGKDVSIDASLNLDIDATTLTVEGTTTLELKGALVKLNGGCQPVARIGDSIVGAGAGVIAGNITGGSTTVFSC